MRLHQKLALRALVGSQSLHSDFGQHGSNLKNLDNNTLAGDTLLASPHVSKQIKSGNSGTIYTLADVAECVLPTLEDVPILYVPVNKRGGPLDQPDPEMWHALNMNEWTKQLFNNCPAVRNTVCNDKGGDNGERCGFATSISTLLIGGIRRHKNAVDYAGFPCDANQCDWGEHANADRGYMTSSNDRKTLPSDADEDDIMEYRRWYTMVAIKAVWRYHRVLKYMLDQSVITEGLQLQQLIDTFAPPDLKKAESFSVWDFLKMVRTLTSFLPFGNEVNLVLNGIDALVDATGGHTEKLWRQDAIAVASNVANGIKQSHFAIGEFVDGAVQATQTYQNQWGDALPEKEEDAETMPKLTLPAVQDMLVNLFTEMKKSIAKRTTSAIKGDPMAPGGFYQLATTGMFSSWQDTEDWSSVEEKATQYTIHLREKLMLSIFRYMKVWIYRKRFASAVACEADASARKMSDWAGRKCQSINGPKTGPVYSYLPMTYVNYQFTDTHNSHVTDLYGKVNDKTVTGLFPDLSIDHLYRKSAECFEASQPDFYKSQGTTCHGVWDGPARNFSPVKPWSEEVSLDINLLKLDPRSAQCHYNIPVLDADSPVVTQGCKDRWFLSRKPDFYGYYTSGANFGGSPPEYCYIADISPSPWTFPGPAMNYGRNLFYPNDDLCNDKVNSRIDDGIVTRRDKQAPPSSYYDGYR